MTLEGEGGRKTHETRQPPPVCRTIHPHPDGDEIDQGLIHIHQAETNDELMNLADALAAQQEKQQPKQDQRRVGRRWPRQHERTVRSFWRNARVWVASYPAPPGADSSRSRASSVAPSSTSYQRGRNLVSSASSL